MAAYLLWVELAGYALGTIGASLLFLELFQEPSYVTYKPELDRYRLTLMADEISEYTNLGRLGAFLLAAAFALLFVATLMG